MEGVYWWASQQVENCGLVGPRLSKLTAHKSRQNQLENCVMDCDITPRNSTDFHHLARVGMAWAMWA